MTADSAFVKALEDASEAHRKSKCRCGMKMRAANAAGPDFDILMAAWRVAQALADEFDAPADQVASAGQKTAALLDAYRRIRRGA